MHRLLVTGHSSTFSDLPVYNNSTDETQGPFEDTTHHYFDSLYCRYSLLPKRSAYPITQFLSSPSWDSFRTFHPLMARLTSPAESNSPRSSTAISTHGTCVAGCSSDTRTIFAGGLKKVFTSRHDSTLDAKVTHQDQAARLPGTLR